MMWQDGWLTAFWTLASGCKNSAESMMFTRELKNRNKVPACGLLACIWTSGGSDRQYVLLDMKGVKLRSQSRWN